MKHFKTFISYVVGGEKPPKQYVNLNLKIVSCEEI